MKKKASNLPLTSEIHQPADPSDWHLPLFGLVAELKHNLMNLNTKNTTFHFGNIQFFFLKKNHFQPFCAITFKKKIILCTYNSV